MKKDNLAAAVVAAKMKDKPALVVDVEPKTSDMSLDAAADAIMAAFKAEDTKMLKKALMNFVNSCSDYEDDDSEEE